VERGNYPGFTRKNQEREGRKVGEKKVKGRRNTKRKKCIQENDHKRTVKRKGPKATEVNVKSAHGK